MFSCLFQVGLSENTSGFNIIQGKHIDNDDDDSCSLLKIFESKDFNRVLKGGDVLSLLYNMNNDQNLEKPDIIYVEFGAGDRQYECGELPEGCEKEGEGEGED